MKTNNNRLAIEIMKIFLNRGIDLYLEFPEIKLYTHFKIARIIKEGTTFYYVTVGGIQIPVTLDHLPMVKYGDRYISLYRRVSQENYIPRYLIHPNDNDPSIIHSYIEITIPLSEATLGDVIYDFKNNKPEPVGIFLGATMATVFYKSLDPDEGIQSILMNEDVGISSLYYIPLSRVADLESQNHIDSSSTIDK